MIKYTGISVLAVLLVLNTGSVSASDSVNSSVSNSSFIAIKESKPDVDAKKAELGAPGTFKRTVICQKKPLVVFKTQVLSPTEKFKLVKFQATCDVKANTTKVGIVVAVPQSSLNKFVSFFGGKNENNVIKKVTDKCKVTDEVITFWLDDKASDFKIECGKSKKDGKDTSTQTNNQTYQQPNNSQQQPEWTKQTAQQAAQQGSMSQPTGGGGQQSSSGYEPYNGYETGYGDELYGDLLDEVGDYNEEAIDPSVDEWDDWDDSTGFESDGSGLYGAVNPEDSNSVDGSISQEEYYYEDGDDAYTGTDYGGFQGNTDDAIAQLLGGYEPQISDNTNIGGESFDWGELDANYSDLSLYELADMPTYENFREYYSGDITEDQWRNWRQWVYSHNSSNWTVNLDGEFYDKKDREPYGWYNPYGWWVGFANWWSNTSPANVQYDI